MVLTVLAATRVIKRFQGEVLPIEHFGHLFGGGSGLSGSPGQEVAQDGVHLVGLDEEAVMPV